ncbi:MAG TPA: hypothetical protein VN726_00140 [Hanamia sp.]|nr:hypothetical protein [Hanamia sp.]
MIKLLGHSKFLFVILLLLKINTSFGQNSNRNLLIGKWQFEKFMPGDNASKISSEEAAMIRNANSKNKGVFMTFFADNKFKTEQKGGLSVNNSSGRYLLLNNHKVVIEKDTVELVQLDKTYLKMYMKGRPIAVFKRVSF